MLSIETSVWIAEGWQSLICNCKHWKVSGRLNYSDITLQNILKGQKSIFVLSFAQTQPLNPCLGRMQTCLSFNVTTAILEYQVKIQRSSESCSVKTSWSLDKVFNIPNPAPRVVSPTSQQRPAENHSTNSNCGFMQRKGNTT